MSEGPDGTTAVVDRNEPELFRMLTLGHPDVENWREEFLDAADLIVNGVGIERKTPSDFASAMTEDRLDEQVRKLDDAFEDAVILLEGEFDDFGDLVHSGIKPESARGKAASIHMRWGIPVVPTGGDASTERGHRLLVDYGVRLGRKATEEPSSGYLRGSVVGSDEPLGKRLWGCFEGVGPTRAGDLYEEFGGPVEFVRSDEVNVDDHFRRLFNVEGAVEELGQVDGIGEKTAQSLVEQLLGE